MWNFKSYPVISFESGNMCGYPPWNLTSNAPKNDGESKFGISEIRGVFLFQGRLLLVSGRVSGVFFLNIKCVDEKLAEKIHTRFYLLEGDSNIALVLGNHIILIPIPTGS